MFDQLVPRFNSGWQPSSGFDYPSGIDRPDDIEWKSAFSGVDGLSSARKNPDGSYNLYRTINPEEQYVSRATVGPDGTVSMGGWNREKVGSLGQTLGEFAALAALAAGGLNAAGFFGAGGAGAGAGAGALGGAGSAGTAGADALGSYFGGLGGAEGSLAASGFSGAVPASASLLPAGVGGGAAGSLGSLGAGVPGDWAALASNSGAPAWEAAAGAFPEAAMGSVGGSLPANMAADFGLSGGIGNALTSQLPGSPGQWLNLGGNLLSGAMGSRAAGKASDAQLQAGREANALLKYMYDTTRTDNLPALESRNYALGGYRGLLANPSAVTSDPGYKFGYDQGLQALERSAAARGGLYSGKAMKNAQRFGQDYAGTKFDNALNRFGNLAGLGQVGAGTIANAGQNYASQAGNNRLGMGNAAASGYVGSANAWNNALSGILNNWQDNQLLKNLPRVGG